MKILKLLNKSYLSILIILFFSIVNSFSENEPVDIWNIDKERVQDNSENKNVLVKSLVDRVKKNNLKEVIIATSATIEGQTTAHYIEDLIKNDKIKITKLAQGLPVGGEIEQLDDGTLFSAFKNRVPVADS